MLRNFDHVTIAVRDVDAAKSFFGLLGFREDQAVVISGEKFARYMGVPGIEAEHVTLVHESAAGCERGRAAQRGDGFPRSKAGLPGRARGHHGGARTMASSDLSDAPRSTRRSTRRTTRRTTR